MASILPGYEYDIFISYRQNDNKRDGWVTNFVEALKDELEATLKNPVSVYFDENPHDGLLETHQVDSSLAKKLKCLVFIPIISQTYCDESSYAWQHEFLPFIKMAKEDELGLNINLKNGNVASRVLPVQIHELEDEDEQLIESELGGKLRSIQFIYKTAGVNRPLRPIIDDPKENLNHTVFRDQINKVANALKEIGSSILKNVNQEKTQSSPTSTTSDYFDSPSSKKTSRSTKLVLGSIFSLLLLAAIYFIYNLQKVEDSIDQEIEKSIAVLPFTNLSDDNSSDALSDGFTEDVLSHLSRLKGLKVISRTSVMQYKGTTKTIPQIAKELGVSYVLEGSVRKSGDNMRITAQLINSSTDEHLWAESYDRPLNDIFAIQSEVAMAIADILEETLTLIDKESMASAPTDNLEAYQSYLRGRYFTNKPHFSHENWVRAEENFQMAVELDDHFALAYAELARTHAKLYNLRYDMSESRLEKADFAAANALELDPKHSGVNLAIGYYYLWAHRDQKKALEYFDIAETGLSNNVDVLIAKASIFWPQGRWQEFINLYKIIVRLSPRDAQSFNELGGALQFTKNYKEAIDAFNQGITLDPEAVWNYLGKAFAIMSWKGANQGSRDVLSKVSTDSEFYLWAMYYQEIMEGNYQNALQLVANTDGYGIKNKMEVAPKSMLYAFINNHLGKKELAQENYKKAQQILQTEIKEYPEDYRFHSAMGIAYAGLGQNEMAMAEGKKAIELLPITKNAFYGVEPILKLALIYTMIEEFDLALDQLDYVLSVPYFWTIEWLKNDMRFDPLRDHPKYRELMEKYEENQ